MYLVAEMKMQVRRLVETNQTLTARVLEADVERLRLERTMARLEMVERDRERIAEELDQATAALRDIRAHLQATVEEGAF